MAYRLLDSFVVDGIINQRILLQAPLDYSVLQKGQITVVVNVVQKYDKDIHNHTSVKFPSPPKPIAYLQGGPGFPCAVPLSNKGYIKFLLEKGYQVILYDQRGTGLSTPIEVRTLDKAVPRKENPKGPHYGLQLTYLMNFRADYIVEDMEMVRWTLFGTKQKWLLLGQSYGGFCSFTYISRYPDSLNAVLVTGGVPPIGISPDRVYVQTYKRTKERNAHYYRKYPQDVKRVKEILAYLSKNAVTLPNGGKLSVERFQQLGIKFGAHGGTDEVHALVTEFWIGLEAQGAATYLVLTKIQNEASFDTNVIYALFQEAIYCDSVVQSIQKTSWAADRARYAEGNQQFIFDEKKDGPVYFTGEMVYKSMFEDYAELAKLKNVAYALHDVSKWRKLYDPEVLRSLSWDKLPIVSATYVHDQYVDFSLTMETKERYFSNDNLRQYISSEHFHNGLRSDPENVLGALFRLLEEEVD